MKTYLAKGIYYEMQADAKKADKGFETVDFPFAASPKSDFVDWLNNNSVAALVAPKFTESDTPLLVEPKGEPYDSALPAFQPRKPMVAQAGPPTPADIAVDREQRAERLDRISVEEEIHSCDARRLGTLADCIANRFHELAKGLS